MSGAILPLPEPPAEDVQELQQLLTYARAHHNAARVRLARAQQIAGYSHPSSLLVRVMTRVRAFEADEWAREVAALEEHARSMGLQL